MRGVVVGVVLVDAVCERADRRPSQEAQEKFKWLVNAKNPTSGVLVRRRIMEQSSIRQVDIGSMRKIQPSLCPGRLLQ